MMNKYFGLIALAFAIVTPACSAAVDEGNQGSSADDPDAADQRPGDGDGLGLIQQAMWERHAFQCAFCAPGFLMTVRCLLADNPTPTTAQIKEELSGNLCRCTGYASILEGVAEAVAKLASAAGGANDA